MHTPKALALSSLFAAGLAASGMAMASGFTPVNSKFGFGGLIFFERSDGGTDKVLCLTRFDGFIDGSGNAFIYDAKIDNPSLLPGLCPNIQPAHLPWTLSPGGTNRFYITGIGFNVPTVSNCGGKDFSSIAAGLKYNDDKTESVFVVNDLGLPNCKISALLNVDGDFGLDSGGPI